MFKEQDAYFRGRAILDHHTAQGVLTGLVGKDMRGEGMTF